MKVIRKVGPLMILMSMISGLFGCASDKVNYEVPTFSEDDVIYRSAWWCPKPTEENYNVYQECGLNTLFLVNHNFRSQWDTLPGVDSKSAEQITYENAYFIGHTDRYEGETQTDKALKLCKEMGLYTYLAQGDMYFEWVGSDLKAYEDLTFNYDEYKDNIIGLFAGDEPIKPEIMELAKDIDKAEEAFPNVPYFANLHPAYADARNVLQAESYTDYVETYCKEFLGKLNGPRLLSVDYYPFQHSNIYNWTMSYEELTNFAKEYNAKFHTFIQIQEQDTPGVKIVNEQDVRLQVNTALAYGASQYSYFLYDTAIGTEFGGMIDTDGNPTAQYNHAKVVNAEVESLEHALLHYEHVCTIPMDALESVSGFYIPTSVHWDVRKSECKVLKDVTTSNYILVSLFQDKDGNEAYYVVNFYEDGQETVGENSKVTLKFDRMKHVTLYGSKNLYEGEKVALKNHTYSFELEPGDGIFIIPSVK